MRGCIEVERSNFGVVGLFGVVCVGLKILCVSDDGLGCWWGCV